MIVDNLARFEILLGSSVVIALINMIRDIVIENKRRKNQKEDRLEDKHDILKDLSADVAYLKKEIKEIKKSQDTHSKAFREQLTNTIIYAGNQYVNRGYCTMQEYLNLQRMADVAYEVGADGLVTAIMTEVQTLIEPKK